MHTTDRERQLEIVCQKLLKYFGEADYVVLAVIVEEDPSTLAVCVSLARAALAEPAAKP